MAEKLETPKSNLTPETFLEHYRAVSRARTVLTEAQAQVRNAMKRAKAAGIATAQLSAAIALTKIDKDRRDADFADLARYMAWLQMPIGTQGALFAGEMPKQKAADEHNEFEAEQRGYEDGKAGAAGDNAPYALGSPLHQAWYNGWSRGQAFLAQQMAVDGEKPARGRKKARGNPEDRPVSH
jgi:ribosome modulation factor/uncharacterized protein (UPF0335 family)